MFRSVFASLPNGRTCAATDRLTAAADRLRRALELRYDSQQPRHPAGTSEGGRWRPSSSGHRTELDDGSGVPEEGALGEQIPVDSRLDEDEQSYVMRQSAPPSPAIVEKSYVLKGDSGESVRNIYGNEILIPKEFPHGAVEKSIRDIKMDISNAETAYFGLAEFAMGLARFRTFGEWDAQRLSGHFVDEYRDFSTIIIGYYGGSIGLSESSMLEIENTYAKYKSRFSKYEPMDEYYKYLPRRNVYNTKIGYDLAARK